MVLPNLPFKLLTINLDLKKIFQAESCSEKMRVWVTSSCAVGGQKILQRSNNEQCCKLCNEEDRNKAN